MARKYKRDKNGRFASGSGLSDRLARYDTYKRVAGYAGAAAGLAAAGYVGHRALTSRRIGVSEIGSHPVSGPRSTPALTGRTASRGLPPAPGLDRVEGGILPRDFLRRSTKDMQASVDAVFGPNRVNVERGDLHRLMGLPNNVVVSELDFSHPAHGIGFTVGGPVRMTVDNRRITIGKLERSFSREGDTITAHHDLFKLNDGFKGTGVATGILRSQVEAYDQLGVKRIVMEAGWDGRYVWPKMGAELADDRQLTRINRRLGQYAKAEGLPTPERVTSISKLAQLPIGKAFLLSKWSPNTDLEIDLRGKSGDAFRASLRKKK